MKSFIIFAASLVAATAPILTSNAEVIPDSYVIKFKDHVTDAVALEHHLWVEDLQQVFHDERAELRKRGIGLDAVFSGLKHKFSIGDSFSGYSGHFPESVIEDIRNHPDVDIIERDSVVHTLDFPVEADECDGDLERNAPWGLARICHRNTLSFGTFNKYLYAADGGEGVDVYVIDTGCNIDHVDFEDRAKWGKTIPSGDEDIDGNGHGTHCSGTIAGKRYGVAKKARIHAVKVLRSNGSGSMSDVVSGVEYAATSHLEQVQAAKKGKRKGFKGSCANLSLGGGRSDILDRAVNAAATVGLHVAVAAGNDNADACKYSPARASKVVTVGATALDDSRAYFSNWGQCVDILAPGLSIQSCWIGSEYAVNTISGTSMASPHVCGLMAYYLSLQKEIDSPDSVLMSPEELKKILLNISTTETLTDLPKDTPNRLAWNGGGCNNYSDIVGKGGFAVTH